MSILNIFLYVIPNGLTNLLPVCIDQMVQNTCLAIMRGQLKHLHQCPPGNRDYCYCLLPLIGPAESVVCLPLDLRPVSQVLIFTVIFMVFAMRQTRLCTVTKSVLIPTYVGYCAGWRHFAGFLRVSVDFLDDVCGIVVS